VHQQAVKDFSKVHFLPEFSDLDINDCAKKFPSVATASAGQEDTSPSAEGGENESQRILPSLPLQHLSGANEPISSLTVEEIATKFRFGDAGQLCIFAKDNVVITPISPPLSPDIANGPHTPRWYSAMQSFSYHSTSNW
jgi:hypothetical protein